MSITRKQKLRNQFPALQNERLLLRRVLPEDEADLYRLINEPLVKKYILFRQETARSSKRILRYFEDCHLTLTSLHFVVVLRDSRQFAGLCSFQRWNEEEGSASIGYMIEPSCWNRGIATEAARMLLEYGFDCLGLKKISAACDSDNAASGRVLAKCGFLPAVREGRPTRLTEKGLQKRRYFWLTAEMKPKWPMRYTLLHN